VHTCGARTERVVGHRKLDLIADCDAELFRDPDPDRNRLIVGEADRRAVAAVTHSLESIRRQAPDHDAHVFAAMADPPVGEHIRGSQRDCRVRRRDLRGEIAPRGDRRGATQNDHGAAREVLERLS